MEYCSSVSNSTMKKKKKQISGNFLSKISASCSFVLSHPLYLSYFLFFSPYIIKLLAFLSPLFFTTTLLCLSLFTSIFHDSLSFSSLLESLQQRGEEEDESLELEGFEEFEVYIIVFGSSTFDPHGEFSQFGSLEENPVEFSREIDGGSSLLEGNPDDEKEEKVLGVLISEEKESPVENSGEIEGKFCGIPISDQVIEEELEEEKILGVLISDEWCFPAKEEKPEKKLMIDTVKAEEKSPQMADKKCVELGEVLTASNCKPLEFTPSSINGGNQTQQRQITKSHSRKHGEADCDTNYIHSTTKKHDDDEEEDKFSYSNSPQSERSLSNMGSMRKEKEWRRTLACKLFEERHNVGGGGGGVEEMDSLWEAYEKTEENRGKQRTVLKKKNSVLSFDEDNEDGEEEDEERDNGKLCCLQALKFSAVKMNFGMGKKPGFLKITKAFKGIGGGWLSHHSNHRSSGGRKKGKN